MVSGPLWAAQRFPVRVRSINPFLPPRRRGRHFWIPLRGLRYAVHYPEALWPFPSCDLTFAWVFASVRVTPCGRGMFKSRGFINEPRTIRLSYSPFPLTFHHTARTTPLTPFSSLLRIPPPSFDPSFPDMSDYAFWNCVPCRSFALSLNVQVQASISRTSGSVLTFSETGIGRPRTTRLTAASTT